MSALLPSLLVSEAVKELQLPPPVAPAELKRKVDAGVERLAMFQHPDGGWGWWRGDDSHPFLTAYVAMGLQTARQQGFAVREDVLAKGRSALERQLDEQKLEPDVEAWSLYALSLMKQATRVRRDHTFSRAAQLSPWGLSLLGLSLIESADDRSAIVASELAQRVKRSDAGAFWSAAQDPMFDEPADFSIEATAFALRFLSHAAPASALLPEAARWLVENRKRGYYWDTTKRTALVIFGLTRYLARSQELKPDYSVTVFVNDRKAIEKTFTAADALSVTPLSVQVADAELKPGNQIRVELNGTGRLSLAANWEWRTLTVPPAVPEGNGLAIRREYYVLKPERAGGKVTWSPVPVTGGERPGDLIGVRLVVTAEKPRDYVLIEDPIPSGSEIVTREELYEITRGRELSRSWWSRREERDDRISFFPSHLPKGETTYSYLLKLTHSGRFVIPPARVEPMYSPGVVSATPQGLLEVKP